MLYVIMKRNGNEQVLGIEHEWVRGVEDFNAMMFRSLRAAELYARKMAGLNLLDFGVVMVDPKGIK